MSEKNPTGSGMIRDHHLGDDLIVCPPLSPSPMLLRISKGPRRRRVAAKIQTTVLLIVAAILLGMARGYW